MFRLLNRPAPAALALAGLLACVLPAHAERGKLLLTGGVSTIDGVAGGGLTPWAVTGSYATTGEIGGTAFVTGAKTQDYSLATYGAAVTFKDRVELSIARQDFDTKKNLAPLGLAGLHLKQDIFGLKVRVAGDAVLDSDTLMPQIAVGVLHKKTDAGALGPTLFGPLGAKDRAPMSTSARPSSSLPRASSSMARCARPRPTRTAFWDSAARRATATSCSPRSRWPSC